jgi:hypothetical protein
MEGGRLVMNVLLWVILAHLLYDFHWQGDFVGTMKSKYWFIMFIHCLTYALVITATLVLLGALQGWWVLWVLLVSHILIDSWRVLVSRKKGIDSLDEPLFLDQMLHLVVLMAVTIPFWQR